MSLKNIICIENDYLKLIFIDIGLRLQKDMGQVTPFGH